MSQYDSRAWPLVARQPSWDQQAPPRPGTPPVAGRSVQTPVRALKAFIALQAASQPEDVTAFGSQMDGKLACVRLLVEVDSRAASGPSGVVTVLGG